MVDPAANGVHGRQAHIDGLQVVRQIDQGVRDFVGPGRVRTLTMTKSQIAELLRGVPEDVLPTYRKQGYNKDNPRLHENTDHGVTLTNTTPKNIIKNKTHTRNGCSINSLVRIDVDTANSEG